VREREGPLKFRRRRPLLGFLCLVYASQGRETDKKRRVGRPGEFLDSLSVGGPRRGDEWYARTGGPPVPKSGTSGGPRKRREGVKRDPMGSDVVERGGVGESRQKRGVL